MSQPIKTVLQGLYARPYFLLISTMAMWGGHTAVSRLAVGEISPASLTFLRWLAVSGIMLAISRQGLRQYWPQIKPRLGYFTAMGTLGFTAYNILLYWAAHTTTAINIGIINAAMPAMIFIGALAMFRQPVRPLQWIGLLVSSAGVIVTAAKGEWATLLTLSVNRGDIQILIAVILYAGYSVLLRNRPLLPSLVFFALLAFAALASSLIPLAIEIAAGEFFLPSWKGWLLLLFVVIFPSLLSQIFYIRGVELIGPGRAGLFSNVVPLFSTGFAMLILGEKLAMFHIVALVLVLGGIFLAEWRPNAKGAA